MREREDHRYEGSKMTMNKYLSIITLNVNRLNVPIKRHRVAEWIRKHDPPQNKRPTQTKREGLGKKIYSKQMDEKKKLEQ